MKVTVKPLKGETFDVEYEPETLVKDLKESIAKLKSDMAVDQQKLIYAGKILTNETPMKDYGIKEGEFIVVMVAKAKPPPGAAAPAAAAPAPAPAAATPAAGETATPAAAPDATAMANSAMPTGAAGMESAIEQLMAMGFERDQCERCLRAAFGNPDRAVEYLMSGIPDGIGRELDAAAQPPPAAGGAPPAAGGGGGGGMPTGGAFPAMPTGGAFPAMPTGGGAPTQMSDAELPPALAALRNSPQFAQLAQLVATNPAALQQMLPALAASNPEAAQAVQEHPEAFMRMMQEAAAGAGAGGGGMGGMGGGGGMGGMGGMGGSPAQMAQIAQMVTQNPEMLQQIVAEIQQSDPALAAQIQADPQAFANTMQAMAAGGMGGGGGMPGGGGGGGGGHVVRLTEEESQAVARLCELGFERQVAAQAYLACDKNEELAANYLFEHGMDGDD